MRKTRVFRPFLGDRLEDRTVPSALTADLGGFHGHDLRGGQFGPGGGLAGGGIAFGPGLGGQVGPGQGPGGLTGLDLGGCRQPGGGAGASSLLDQDARLVQQEFQTLGAAVQAAAAALRQTATTTSGPSSAGLTTYHNAIDAATSALNQAISKDLSNLTHSGSTLAGTIAGFTATLADELKSAGTGLANSTNQSVLALQQEANGYLRSALNQTIGAIRNDQPAGTLTPATLQTYSQAVRTADQAFNTAISNARQAAISKGMPLDSTAVSSAVNALKTALTSALNGLGSQFTSSGYDPTATVSSQLDNLQAQLLALVAPTANNNASARLFSRTVNSTVAQGLGQINQSIATSFQNYNQSLL